MAHLLYFERTVNFILLKKRLEQYLHLYCYCIPLLNGGGSAFPLCWTWAAIGKLRVAVGQAVLRAVGRKQALKNWREKECRNRRLRELTSLWAHILLCNVIGL
jgi:hypothetical protein